MDRYDTRPGGSIRSVVRGRQVTVRGYAIVFNQPSVDLGGFVEVIAPSAVDRTLRDPSTDLRALFNHDPGRVIARQKNGTLRVEKDHHGLAVEIDLDEDESSLARKIDRGDIDGMSFGFVPFGPDGYSRDRGTNPPTLTLRDAVIREVSVVSFPAYPQTELAVRHLGSGRPTVSELLARQPPWLRR